MSGIDTIFECVCVCKPQTTWKIAQSLITTYAYFPSQVNITIYGAHTDTLSALLLKIRIEDQNCPRSFQHQSESERRVKADFVMLCVSCCFSQHSGALASYWITETFNFHEETSDEDNWNNTSDLNCFSTIQLEVL